MSMSTKKNIAIVLLVLSMLLWVLRKINILYIPGLSMFLLALSMVLVGVMMFQLKEKKKLAGTMISWPSACSASWRPSWRSGATWPEKYTGTQKGRTAQGVPFRCFCAAARRMAGSYAVSPVRSPQAVLLS